MKLEVGNYVRYKRGNAGYGIEPPERIAKVIARINNSDILSLDVKQDILESDVIKASDKLIDLVEVGDYVNGRYVYGTGYNIYDYFGVKIEEDLKHSQVIEERDIKSIVTKECFELMSYKVGN